MSIELNGELTLLCVFTLCYLGDMPQQAVNSLFKTSRAFRGCRLCDITEENRGNLDYDITEHGRFHYQTINMRQEMCSQRTKLARTQYGTKWGLNPEPTVPPLAQISPALDIILTRPADPAHSEYGGISSLAHEMLIQAILTKAASKEYTLELQKFPCPPGWARLQSPLHHLKSYSLSDHVRWSIIAPILLRVWLRKSHFQKHFLDATKDQDSVAFVVSCYAAFAKSNSILMGNYITQEDRARMEDTIKLGRTQFQALCMAASKSIRLNPRRHATPRSGSATPFFGRSSQAPLLSVADDNDKETLKKQESQYAMDSKRPNVHVGVHYKEMMEEYGVPSNVNVLIGEDKHR